ncbi:leucine-rich repeat-containing protein 57 [Chelonus insularis]|uniref:leucine-rich repeat-containing protein 57 n=1 Tax=Chelonus insularis TaxID=460826 RepID=UPI00158B891F|nr:leucine-rich repeat-containing protein 57 [Chelonus insularis]
MGNTKIKQHYETAKKTGILNISNRKMMEIPANMKMLAPMLRTLDLSQNLFKEIPDEIGIYVILKQLNLSHNKLSALPEAMGALVKLEILNASCNQISRLPDSLSKLTHLKQVNLSDNQIAEFPLMFCGLKHLDVLDISKNKLTCVPDGVVGLHVIELNLNQNQISVLSDKMADCPRLKTLRLEENCLQFTAIPTKIFKESNISNISLEGNLFENKKIADIDGYEAYMERYTAVKKKMF